MRRINAGDLNLDPALMSHSTGADPTESPGTRHPAEQQVGPPPPEAVRCAVSVLRLHLTTFLALEDSLLDDEPRQRSEILMTTKPSGV
jgi:hypothetical protein